MHYSCRKCRSCLQYVVLLGRTLSAPLLFLDISLHLSNVKGWSINWLDHSKLQIHSLYHLQPIIKAGSGSYMRTKYIVSVCYLIFRPRKMERSEKKVQKKYNCRFPVFLFYNF